VTRTYFNLTVLVVLLLVGLPMWAAPGGVQGQIAAVKGKVSLVHGQASPVLLHKHDTVEAGDEILTDHKSSAMIRMPMAAQSASTPTRTLSSAPRLAVGKNSFMSFSERYACKSKN
jgi:hypothetical protein